jgi:hypothetical protein
MITIENKVSTKPIFSFSRDMSTGCMLCHRSTGKTNVLPVVLFGYNVDVHIHPDCAAYLFGTHSTLALFTDIGLVYFIL